MPNTKKKSNRNRRQASTSKGRNQGSRNTSGSSQTDQTDQQDRERMDDDGGLESEPSSRSGRASST